MGAAPRVSVLTPVYNTSEFLAQCLDSLAAQTLQDIEFICINDGSTDNSLEILQEYAARDSRFKIIDKPNGGYGQSMNMGLDAACGEYIGILESDDFAEPNMFEELYVAAAAGECDIVRSNRFDYENGIDTFNELFKEFTYGTVYFPADIWRVFVPAPSIWSAIYRREMLSRNGIKFLETPGASYQDTGFVYKSLIAASRLMLLEDAFVHYRLDNANSSVKSIDKVYCVCDEFDSIEEFLDSHPEFDSRYRGIMQAIRYKSYNWNNSRLTWGMKKEFLERFAADFRKLDVEGKLDKNYFNTPEWGRVHELMDDYELVYARELPLVTAIVPAYNAEAHIYETIDSLACQTLTRLEILVIDDGSTDRTAAIAHDYAVIDHRIAVISQENRGVAAARNVGLDNAHGTYICFIDAGDVVPSDSLEELYRYCNRSGADLSIGVIREFNALLSHEFERTVSLSKKETIDKYDFDIVWSFSVNNKLFCRDKIEQLSLRFDEGMLIAEDGLFLFKYVFASGKIVGCPKVVLDYRRGFFWDGQSATHTANSKFVEDLISAHEQIIALAKESIARDAAAASGQEEKARLELASAQYPNELHRRLVSFLIELQYRLIWLLDDDVVSLMLSKVEEHCSFVSDNEWQRICEWNGDLSLSSGLRTKAQLEKTPLLSVILDVDRSLAADDIALYLQSLYRSPMPCFEIVVPEPLRKCIPHPYAGMGNLRFAEDPDTSGGFVNDAVHRVLGEFVLVMREPVFPNSSALRLLMLQCRNIESDFVAGQVAQIEGEVWKRWRSQDVVFADGRVKGFSRQSTFNRLDCTLNNKVIRTAALREKGIVFTGDSEVDSRMLYENLSFQKRPEIFFITKMSEKEFLGNADLRRDALTAATFFADRADIEHFTRYYEKGKQRAKDIQTTAKRWFVPKDTILFFTNRGSFSENLQLIHDRLEGNKVVMAQPLPYSDAYIRQARAMLNRSKVIVLDDTCHLLRDQLVSSTRTHVVQLWHACGAFKKFGLDNLWVPAWLERSKHAQYELVSVSSDSMRSVYAGAFGVEPYLVRDLGVPRTDLLLDAAYVSAKKAEFAAKHPELAGKRVVLYCPTFRQKDGRQVSWQSGIDWPVLSESLPADTVFVVKPHPLERFDLLAGQSFGNILTLDDCTTNEVLFAADLVLTDYSSIIFDAVLLNKPTLFYCPDLEEYQTGFYLAFPDDLSGELVARPEELLDAIERALDADYVFDDAHFREKFLGACDGRSSDRIADYIKEHFL